MMKRIAMILALAPALAGATDLAPGTFELAGSTNLSFTTGSTKDKTEGFAEDKTDHGAFGLNALGLYYVAPNLGLGLSFGYNSETDKFSDGTKRTLSDFHLGPAIGYEIPVAPELAVFGLGHVDYVSGKLTLTGNPDQKASGWGFGLEAGVKYFPVKSVSLDAALAYDYATVEDDQTPKTTTTVGDFGLKVGLSVYFGGK